MAEAPAPAAQDWRAALPEDMRGAPALKDVKDVTALAQSYLSAQAALGSSLRLPSKDAGDEGRKAFSQKLLEVGKDYGVIARPREDEDDTEFYRSLGRPDKAEEYETPDYSAHQVEIDQQETDVVRAAALEAGLSKRQFKKLAQKMLDSRLAGAIAAKGAAEAATAELKQEWGNAYDVRREATGRRLEAQGAPKALIEAWKADKIDPTSARWLYHMMEAFGDEPGELQKQGKRGGGGPMTPEEAIARVEEVEKQLEKLAPGDPSYDALVKRRVQLMEVAHPG